MTSIKSVIFNLLIALAIVACSGKYTAPISDRTRSPQKDYSNATYHVVKKGETLYSISWLYGLDYTSLASWNGIKKPYRIYQGTKLRVKPYARITSKKTTKTTSSNTSKPSTIKKKTTKSSRKKSTVNQSSGYTGPTKIRQWVWPAKGKLLRGYSANSSGKKGITIGGRPGQAVLAAAPGKVVYSGSGLVRYGKLIIIKHNETYLSAYAHNKKMIVKEGAMVKAGQQIAEMGSTGTNQTILHFEIRKNGKPVNPLYFLPR